MLRFFCSDLMNADNPEEESTTEDIEVEEIKKETKKYIHNCTKCGQCCEKWEEIPIYLDDLQRWTKDGTITHVLPFVQLREMPPAYVRLVIQKHSVEGEDPNPSGCPLYDYENKICNVYASMPLHCASYPLAYNGEKFYLTSKDCPGVGKGEVTKESLKESKDTAGQEYREKNETLATLPGVYTIFMGHIMRQSAEAMKDLSEEDKKRIEEIMSSKESVPESKEDKEEEE